MVRPRRELRMPRRAKAAVFLAIVGVVSVTVILSNLIGDPLLVVALASLCGLPLMLTIHRFLIGPIRLAVHALGDGLLSYAEKDYGFRLSPVLRDPDFAELIERFNQLGAVLRDEHNDVYQKEMLLQTVIEAAPLAILLADEAGRVVLANNAARDLLHDGKSLEGHDLPAVWARSFPAIAALPPGEDGLVTVDSAEATETLHVARRYFTISTREHALFLLKSLTREVAQKEGDAWKKAIRVISHELNNSLAPISSLIHSARLIQRSPEHAHRLGGVFDTIEERATHLKSFLEGYARLAKLPRPTPRAMPWSDFLAGIERLYSFHLLSAPPHEPGWFDPAQLEQVLINLLKNAVESGSPAEEIALEIVAARGGFEIRVLDRGKGMSPDELKQAVLPFYSTKKTGSGLGLALCHDIIEAHAGKLTLTLRPGGGVVVTVWLPNQP